jgi:hypothetical protein
MPCLTFGAIAILKADAGDWQERVDVGGPSFLRSMIRSACGAARPDQTVWRGLQSVGRLFCALTRVESVAPGRVGANAFDPLSGAVHPRSNPLRVRGGGLRLALLRRGPTTASSVSSSSLRSAFSAARLEKTVRGGLSPSDLTRGEPVAWGGSTRAFSIRVPALRARI